MKIKQQSKSDIKGLVDDIKVNVIENVGTADICDQLNIACNIKSLSRKFYYPAFRGKILFWCPHRGTVIAYLLKCPTVGHLNLVKSSCFSKDYFKSKTTDK